MEPGHEAGCHACVSIPGFPKFILDLFLFADRESSEGEAAVGSWVAELWSSPLAEHPVANRAVPDAQLLLLHDDAPGSP